MHLQLIQNKIHELRGQRVMLDFDLAQLYQTETKYLKRAVKQNIYRFPDDFMFELTQDEWDSLRCQNSTLKTGRGMHPKYLPYAFTEQGVAMLSSVLKSKKAIEVNIYIVRAFVFIRQFALTHKELTEKLKELEIKYNKRFKDIYEVLDLLLKDKTEHESWENRRRIGFRVR